MKTYACITSMNQKYYNHCGKSCIDTFCTYWPSDIVLHVYNENIRKANKKKQAQYIDWKVLGTEYQYFIDKNKDNDPLINTFAKKAFSIIHAMENIDCDRLIWIDADVISISSIHPMLLNLLSSDDVLSTHYGVFHDWGTENQPDRKSFSCETGFFILNKKHEKFNKFVKNYKDYYLKNSGHTLRRFYDGEVYGAVVKKLSEEGVKMLELNDDYYYRSPIPRSVLAPYIEHMKAKNKDHWNNESIMASLGLTNENENDNVNDNDNNEEIQ
jgi:hypothetical protein